MSFSRIDLKKFFFPVYYVWALISPSIILLINPVQLRFLPAFYALFGLIWPLTFVVYPAFYISIRSEGTTVNFLSLNLAIPLFLIAWLGPLIHLIWVILKHKKHVSLTKQGNEELGWADYLSGFI